MSGILVGALIGWAIHHLVNEWVERQRTPFIFKCPICGVKVRSSNEAFVAKIARDHEDCEVRP